MPRSSDHERREVGLNDHSEVQLNLDELHLALAVAMARRGAWPERPAWIREAAVESLPPHRFAPQRVWRWDGHAYVPVDRDTDPASWAGEVNPGPDTATVTDGLPTSSLPCQAVVADMLDSLLPEPGHRVLELGKGTGWNAGLLGLRAGPGLVISVEADAGLARAARRGNEEEPRRRGGVLFRARALPRRSKEADLQFVFIRYALELQLTLTYNSEVFTDERAQGLLDKLCSILDSMLEERPIAGIPACEGDATA
ncbi:hypothetical protein GTY84_04575 [Streptomyces sp. SID8352]|nr:hypothetical protein [Streptomyces sp. SID8352]